MPRTTRLVAAAAPAILGLLLAGCSGNGGGGADVAQVNDQKIPQAEFVNRLEAIPQAKSVLNQLVQTALIDQYAQKNNISVPDSDVDAKLSDIKSKYPPGQFDAMVKQQGLSQDDIRKIIREQLIVEKAVAPQVKVTDTQVQAYLAKNHATLDTPEEVRAKHILVADLPTAQKVENLLKGGASFAALAKQYSTDPSTKDKGGELGLFPRHQMVPSFEAAAFSQPIGVVGQPVKSPFGYHIIVVEEKKAAQPATMANSGDKIKKLLQQQQEQQQIPLFLNQLRSQANIQIFDDKLKDAIPPAAPAGATGATGSTGASSGAGAAPSTAASAGAAPSAAASGQ